MSSLKQIEANRRNALKSTGPTTPEGKDRSRCNAVRHGLTAETVIAALEDAEDYQAFEAAVIADYDAESAVERELVLRLASVLWRLRRATGIETAMFELVTAEPGKRRTGLFTPDPRRGSRSLGSKSITPGSNTRNLTRRRETNSAPIRKRISADCFLRLAALPTFPLDRLSRYEHLLWRQARQIVIYAGVVAAPQATAEPLNLSIFVPAARARRSHTKPVTPIRVLTEVDIHVSPHPLLRDVKGSGYLLTLNNNGSCQD